MTFYICKVHHLWTHGAHCKWLQHPTRKHQREVWLVGAIPKKMHICLWSHLHEGCVPWIHQSQHQSWVSESHTPAKMCSLASEALWLKAKDPKINPLILMADSLKATRLTVMKMGSSNKSEGVSKKFRKNVWAKHTLQFGLNIRVPASSGIPIIILWFELHLIKDGVVAFSDASPLRLPGNCDLDDRLDIYAWQLPALNDTHTNLDRKLNLNN